MTGEKLKLTLVSYSSQNASYPSTNALDGSTSSYWRTGSATYPQSIVVELDDFYRLNGFTIYPSTSSYRVSSFKIFVSSDNLNFNEVYSSACSSTASFLKFEFSSVEIAKYVKIEFTGASTSRLYVYEFEIYGNKVCKYLFRNDSVIYTVTDNTLTPLDTTELTAEVFQTYGLDELPEWNVLSNLINPEILYWKYASDNLPDSIPEPMATVVATQTAVPFPQWIISNRIDLTDPTIKGIENATITCEGNVLFAVSFDNKVTWKVWTGTEWSIVSEEFSGMTKELFESITYDNWTELYNGADSFYIKALLSSTDQSITSVYVDFAN